VKFNEPIGGADPGIALRSFQDSNDPVAGKAGALVVNEKAIGGGFIMQQTVLIGADQKIALSGLNDTLDVIIGEKCFGCGVMAVIVKDLMGRIKKVQSLARPDPDLFFRVLINVADIVIGKTGLAGAVVLKMFYIDLARISFRKIRSVNEVKSHRRSQPQILFRILKNIIDRVGADAFRIIIFGAVGMKLIPFLIEKVQASKPRRDPYLIPGTEQHMLDDVTADRVIRSFVIPVMKKTVFCPVEII
jgi:hypothetical protein